MIYLDINKYVIMRELTATSLKEIIGDLSQIQIRGWAINSVKTTFQIKPKKFLRFAEYDLNNSYEHNQVNAIANVKRAIDCQIDSLLFGFGLFEESKKRNLNFPQKVSWMNSLGIISPRILKKINQKRNLLEHEYVCPNKEDVEDALDVATLFIAYTEKFLKGIVVSCHVINKKTKEEIHIGLDCDNKFIQISPIYPKKETKKEIVIPLVSNFDEYFNHLKLILSLYKLK